MVLCAFVFVQKAIGQANTQNVIDWKHLMIDCILNSRLNGTYPIARHRFRSHLYLKIENVLEHRLNFAKFNDPKLEKKEKRSLKIWSINKKYLGVENRYLETIGQR